MEYEIYRDIEGYEDRYMVSNLGNVHSKDMILRCRGNKTRVHKGKLLKPKIDKYGYYYINLYKDTKQKACKVHRLVGKAFLPYSNKYCINHKDCDKQNNSYNNLEWVTKKENTQHARRNGMWKK